MGDDRYCLRIWQPRRFGNPNSIVPKPSAKNFDVKGFKRITSKMADCQEEIVSSGVGITVEKGGIPPSPLLIYVILFWKLLSV